MTPRMDVKLFSRSMRSVELAVSVLLPSALPADSRFTITPWEKAISAMLCSVLNMEKATRKLLAALRTALVKFMARTGKETEQHKATVAHLSNYLTSTTEKTRPAARITPAEDHPKAPGSDPADDRSSGSGEAAGGTPHEAPSTPSLPPAILRTL